MSKKEVNRISVSNDLCALHHVLEPIHYQKHYVQPELNWDAAQYFFA